MFTAIPKRSNNCGRNSPSSGLPLPIMMNFAGCVKEIPSRSTVFHPPAAESRTTSTSESSNKFTSSMYNKPLFALANKPGSYAFVPSLNAFSMSIVPQIRSSVVPSGTSTIGTRIFVVFNASFLLNFARTSGPINSGSVGDELNASFSTTSISGNNCTNERTLTLFAVPRSPMMSTPPMRASTTFNVNANFNSSCATIFTNGNVVATSFTLVESSPA
mmetsp:Transcript_3203/g.11572  ORF Transcript_3203/g.11572 Transcript_3203/m.11572 type:complete len:217 (+) Transcript_3203:625-1275(+)